MGIYDDSLEAEKLGPLRDQRLQTQAERHLTEHGGQWRIARKEHRCNKYFGPCRGDGKIHKGARYLDTHDLRDFTKGPVPYRACSACADSPTNETDK